jgi:hypothetical protein
MSFPTLLAGEGKLDSPLRALHRSLLMHSITSLSTSGGMVCVTVFRRLQRTDDLLQNTSSWAVNAMAFGSYPSFQSKPIFDPDTIVAEDQSTEHHKGLFSNCCLSPHFPHSRPTGNDP